MGAELKGPALLTLVRLVVQSGSDREQIDALDALVASLDSCDGAADLCEALRSSATVEALCGLLASGEASHEVSARILLCLGNLSSEAVDPYGASETKRLKLASAEASCSRHTPIGPSAQQTFLPGSECTQSCRHTCQSGSQHTLNCPRRSKQGDFVIGENDCKICRMHAPVPHTASRVSKLSLCALDAGVLAI